MIFSNIETLLQYFISIFLKDINRYDIIDLDL